ncbi:LOW QUALITY PROTEIN: hypothetical protein KIPB_009888, partial [Kipferlia bialata]
MNLIVKAGVVSALTLVVSVAVIFCHEFVQNRNPSVSRVLTKGLLTTLILGIGLLTSAVRRTFTDASSFDISQVLDCGHSFCQQCLSGLQGTPQGDSDLAQSALSMDELGGAAPRDPAHPLTCTICLKGSGPARPLEVAEHAQTVLCGECGQHIKERRCLQCGLELCSECDLKIHQFRNFQSHVRVECSPGAPTSHPLPCSVHPRMDAACFCLTESRPVCAQCSHGPSHQGHRHVSLEDAAREQAATLTDTAAKVKAWTGRGLCQLQALSQLSNTESGLYNECLANMVAQRAALMQAIEERYARLEQEAAEVHRHRLEHIEHLRASLVGPYTEGQETVSQTAKYTANADPSLLLTHAGAIQERLQRRGSAMEGAVLAFAPASPRPYPGLRIPTGLDTLIEGVCMDPAEMLNENTTGTSLSASDVDERVRRAELFAAEEQ